MTIGRGATIFGCAGPVLLQDERAFFREADPFGFILFARNIETPDQLRRLTADLRAAVGRDAPILVDQEGGRVQRLRAPHWREWDPPLDTVERAGSVAVAARAMRARMRVIGAELRAVGIDANCAPLGDVARPGTHPFLRNRCYGSDPETVAIIARAVAAGLKEAGVLPVVKHLPGHGLSHLDTHLALPTVDAPLDELRAVDFAPFRALNDLPMAMTAHLVFAAVDPGLPATQSPTMIRLIRDEIGFQGLLMSDDLNMEALKGSLADRTARTMAAGVDIALHCKGDLAEMQAVAGAAGDMTPAAADRARAALAARTAPLPLDAALADLADG
ncbi:glycoside hydrolase family 3 N-terminal domain-containing protein [Tabrizicola sp. YIM 78059]|uniref:glycoside hydrolase family 3 N-terminal domain-containing protein n=1 Tax=Tabrizicola sp. YIM 78059 TaxID=2529861 RepID=UPI0010A9CC51|nr:glycoside hydrolase family 3 N-terminal domain-containing protein [Tabrizicola sp. YIM 78059]